MCFAMMCNSSPVLQRLCVTTAPFSRTCAAGGTLWTMNLTGGVTRVPLPPPTQAPPRTTLETMVKKPRSKFFFSFLFFWILTLYCWNSLLAQRRTVVYGELWRDKHLVNKRSMTLRLLNSRFLCNTKVRHLNVNKAVSHLLQNKLDCML